MNKDTALSLIYIVNSKTRNTSLDDKYDVIYAFKSKKKAEAVCGPEDYVIEFKPTTRT